MSQHAKFDFDVAIVGGGPAGLSGALTLGRACRTVAVFDHGKPRNYAAKVVNCFLGSDALSPQQLRQVGRAQAREYQVTFFDCEVDEAVLLTDCESERTAFRIETSDGAYRVRAILLATGMMDQLPEIEGLPERYGSCVHHCPYCDGWEHRSQPLIALGRTSAGATKLAATLLGWSPQVTACSNGEPFSNDDLELLRRLEIPHFSQNVRALRGDQNVGQCVVLDDDLTIPFGGLFFSSGQGQRSRLPKVLGCDCAPDDLIVTAKKQCTNVAGVYLAGDADGHVQFAVVAAAEGAIAATAIHQALLDQDQGAG